MPKTSLDRVKRFYEIFSGHDHVLIMINADPDAIASAMAVKRLLWRKVHTVTISNINIIQRPDNISMIRLLGPELVHFKKSMIECYNRFIIVDSQPSHHEYFTLFEPDVVIDHHPITVSGIKHMDIRPEYGATATILVEYLRAAKINISSKLSTALYYAIKTDTNNFIRKTTIQDIRAFQYLYKYANHHVANKIELGDINIGFLKYFSKALNEKVKKKNKIFVHLGKVPSPDICVIIADFFMRISTIKWSIVSGIYNKKLIIIFRNDGSSKNAGTLANKAFGNMGNAGGHKSMARAEIPVTNMDIKMEQDENVLNEIIERVSRQ